jgi:hypothetical protein
MPDIGGFGGSDNDDPETTQRIRSDAIVDPDPETTQRINVEAE